MSEALIEAMRCKNVILFVGAGVSQNLGLPSYGQLIEQLAIDLGFDSDVFATHGDFLALAEFYHLKKGSIGSLRSKWDREWHEGRDVKSSAVHELIVALDVPIIYTTNYDSWIERAFECHGKRYHKVVGVRDFVNIPQGATQIVKFHGDFSDDSSIVLTETSYFNRLNFESPLDIKLRSDLLGRSVLFIGYSLQDINMRLMLHRLTEQWGDSRSCRPQSFVFLTRPNPVQEAILNDRGITPLVAEFDPPGSALEDFLKRLLRESRSRPDED